MIEKKSSDFVMVNPLTKDAELEPRPGYKIKTYGPDRPFWLYALKLSHGKYYVGYTARYNPYDRIMQHVEATGDGAKWTELHPPLEVLEIRNIEKTSTARVKALEHNLTVKYMYIYGANNVRGGMINNTGRVIRIGNLILMDYQYVKSPIPAALCLRQLPPQIVQHLFVHTPAETFSGWFLVWCECGRGCSSRW